MGQGSPRELIKAHRKAGLEKSQGKPRKPKESKWVKDAQEGNGTQEPANSVRKGPVNTLSHWEGNKQQAQRGLVGIAEWYGRKMLTRSRSEHKIGRGKEGQ